MRKAIYTILAAASLSLASCDNYIDITPTGAITVDSATQYLELVANPARAYYPSAFAMLSDNCWIKESNVIGKENTTWGGINTTFNEQADRNVSPTTTSTRTATTISCVRTSCSRASTKALGPTRSRPWPRLRQRS